MTPEPQNPSPWFAARRFGLGVGLPVAWQGWLLLGSYLAALAGIKWLDHAAWSGGKSFGFALLLPLTAIFLVIAKKRTARKTGPAEIALKDEVHMAQEDTLFICYRKGWQFNCQPRGRAGWLALAGWTLPFLPLSLGLAWLLLRFPENVTAIVVAFTLVVAVWTAVMMIWIASRSEMVDLKAQPKPERRRRKDRP